MFWFLFVNFTLFAGLFRINTTYSNVFLMKSWSKNVNHTNFNMQQNKALSGMITYLCISNSSLQEEAEKMAAKKKTCKYEKRQLDCNTKFTYMPNFL